MSWGFGTVAIAAAGLYSAGAFLLLRAEQPA
jgi:hypothetical protein